jgi:hypothetical protein
MDQVKIDSYEDCVWYMGNGKCKLPGRDGKYSKCFCKSGAEMDEFCIWITKFLKSTPKDDHDAPENSENAEDQWDEYNELVLDEETNQVMRIENPIMRNLNKLFKKLYII